MSEPVIVTPRPGLDSNGNPRAAGSPFTLTALEVAPGNTLLGFGIGSDLSSIACTVYVPLRDEARFLDDDGVIIDDWDITVRGKVYRARPQVWKSGGRGVLAVLAQSATGKAA